VEVVNCEGIDESSENPSDDGEGNQEDELANAIYYSDKKDLMDAIVGMLNSISTLDKNAFTKVRNEFYSLQRGKESELKKALLNAMDFLLNS
jgi:hypothetical protein